MTGEIKPCPERSWTCFHCGETFTTPGTARDHFGFDPSYDPACRIKVGAERGLVMALRKAEADCEEMRRLLHDESSEAYRMYANQTVRHRQQIIAAEESGYEKGLADGREEADRASDACATVQRERDELREMLEEGVSIIRDTHPFLETLHSLATPKGDAAKAVWRRIEKMRAFLARYEESRS